MVFLAVDHEVSLWMEDEVDGLRPLFIANLNVP